jgi:hypothetical protein
LCETLTFLWTDPKVLKGPYTFSRLRELWKAGTINAESKLFLTERDEANRVECFNLRAADIKENLESGKEIDVKGLYARVTGRADGKTS